MQATLLLEESCRFSLLSGRSLLTTSAFFLSMEQSPKCSKQLKDHWPTTASWMQSGGAWTLHKQLCLPPSFQHGAQQEDIKRHSESQCDPPHIQLREGAEKRGGASIIQGFLGGRKGGETVLYIQNQTPDKTAKTGCTLFRAAGTLHFSRRSISAVSDLSDPCSGVGAAGAVVPTVVR